VGTKREKGKRTKLPRISRLRGDALASTRRFAHSASAYCNNIQRVPMLLTPRASTSAPFPAGASRKIPCQISLQWPRQLPATTITRTTWPAGTHKLDLSFAAPPLFDARCPSWWDRKTFNAWTNRLDHIVDACEDRARLLASSNRRDRRSINPKSFRDGPDERPRAVSGGREEDGCHD
jgi:hypothetical protein